MKKLLLLGGFGLDGMTFNFPSFDLQTGQACRVYTNEHHPESCGFSFGHDQAIWGNEGDTATLYDNAGNVVDQKSW